MTYVDLFCGIGGFHQAARDVSCRTDAELECVFASDIDAECQRAYEANYGLRPEGDITKIDAGDIPAHDILFAGFPCQPFSIIGDMQGFEDTRGTLFFEIARIIEHHRPQAFVLENVKMLAGHQKGTTIRKIVNVLEELGYCVAYKVLNALDFGLPQKRERVLIVGFDKPTVFEWPNSPIPMKPLGEILEASVPESYFASEYIRTSRSKWHKPDDEPTIWHENKAGNVSKYPYSCALRAGASYNYLLVDGIRRLTEREMLRLQGFPDSFEIVCTSGQTRKQAGNSVPVPMIAEVMDRVVRAAFGVKSRQYRTRSESQLQLVMERCAI